MTDQRPTGGQPGAGREYDRPMADVTPDGVSDPGHVPVLLDEVLEHLAPGPGQLWVDGTLGRGGHAAALIPRLMGGMYLGLDLDPGNVAFSRERLAPLAERHGVRLAVLHRSFAEIAAVLDEAVPVPPPAPETAAPETAAPEAATPEAATPAVTQPPCADRVLVDLGFASNQLDNPARGMSFRLDGPLDMRLDPTAGPTAAELVNTLPAEALADLLYHHADERLSRRIAAKIIDRRRESPIKTTGELAVLVRQCYGPRGKRLGTDPAARTFLALRIAVNDEFATLERLLADLPGRLGPRGRAGIISFQSQEDRRVKHAMVAWERVGVGRRQPRKPISPGDKEMQANPRARSAKLRVFDRAG